MSQYMSATSPSSLLASAAAVAHEPGATAAHCQQATAAAATAQVPAQPPPQSAASWPADIKRKTLRVAIVTENFLPKVDGVTRTLARLLEHLNAEGHEALVCGPETGMTHYAGHAVVGTFGLPLIIYPGLKLNFMRPRFIRRLQQFQPDVVHFVDPIFLGAQLLPCVQRWLPHVPCVASYHTNLPTYATLFGLPWLEPAMWRLTRSLHDRCEMTFCPSESTRRMLRAKGFKNVQIWSRGVDTDIFNPQARDENLRASWGCTPKPEALQMPLTPSVVPSKADHNGSGRSLHPAADGHSASSSGSSIDDSFICTPPSSTVWQHSGPGIGAKRGTVAFLGGIGACPEMSPPPAYDSLAGIPELPLGTIANFALPPPAVCFPAQQHATYASSLAALEDKLHLASAAALAESESATATAAESSRTVILYVGRISWEKNLRLLIEAFRLLPSSVRECAKLVFVGDGPARAELTRLCDRLGLDASFMGHQKGKRLAAMYASSSVFAFPSFTETFGQVVLEALASGLPVVGLHAEGTSDLVCHGKSGLLLDINTASSSSNINNTSASPAEALLPSSTSLSSSSIHRASPSSQDSATSFADAANEASDRLSSPPRPRQQQQRFTAASGTGVQSRPIPSVFDFAHAMSPNNAGAFTACAKSYSMLLERLILNRPLRAAMGQRALQYASRKTWWDAMDAVVVNYETVVRSHSPARSLDLDAEQLDALRKNQILTVKPALTGPWTKLFIALYIAFFAFLFAYLW
ncbi:glycosyltransferase family 4 protein [Tilletiaria anomala UBC 951]|uniref:Glycosyltransferase family 4 protein n=1 Tax=Tilletiaria anomala (strain ATCC 24038 / CBS 436.72 / UBC 951) TaxID=1037660 RepID=A0A066WGA9_TILAU|nr:glycosyltransferase family 4 protein [Tilletiaria anomala UBC 951]KDN52811.1 glycosyltransferase family 4 protein [Tilletiaria anomala UBC 951]